MSPATASLFASVAFAAAGAASLAYTLSHPGVLASMVNRTINEIGLSSNIVLSHANGNANESSDAQRLQAVVSETVSIAAGDYGHFQTQAEINGRDVDVMVDTGASLVALTLRLHAPSSNGEWHSARRSDHYFAHQRRRYHRTQRASGGV
jgi:aspartyl protease family protein